MSSIWVESLGRSFESALGLLESTIRDCTDELWEASMWEVPARDADTDLAGPNGTLVTSERPSSPPPTVRDAPESVFSRTSPRTERRTRVTVVVIGAAQIGTHGA